MSDPAVRLNAALEGRYAIERELGEGGMATVYLARDLKHKRDVAIKVLKPEVGGALGEARFHREIEIAARLTHPHIVPLHDSGEEDGLLYFVMPVITGGSLRDLLEKGPLPPDTVAEFVRAIAAGLGHAHGQGVVHRDLKPSNILVHEGVVMISDLGIAIDRSEAGDTRFTQTGSSLGTPAYMSPEQIEGIRELDARSDVYALGCITFEMLTGARPFAADSAAALAARILAGEPPRASATNPDLSSRVDTVLRRAMAKRREDRFASAGELADALGVALRRNSVPGRGRRIAASAVAFAIVGIVVLLWMRSVRMEVAEQLATVERVDSLVEAGEQAEAFIAAMSLASPEALPDMEALWSRFASRVSVVSDPPGATVAYRRYASPTDPWLPLGTTPTTGTWLPRGVISLRIERPGYEPLVLNRSAFEAVDTVRLLAPGAAPPGMVPVPAGEVDLGQYAAGLYGIEPLRLGAFFIDRLEVTNAEYKAFVDTRGYEEEQYWLDPMQVQGRSISPSEVQDVFVDRTGRPGPSTWEVGDHPESQANHPVTGLSWYEARAYARYVGKRLPTLYHWHRAATAWASGLIVPRSNLDGTGTLPVGATVAESEFGLRDVAGNAREWVSTTNGEIPFMLGGAWNDPVEAFFDVNVHDPWDRSVTNGMRLISEPDDTTGMAVARGAVLPPKRDFRAETPVSDAEFEIYRRLFEYDPVPLDARIEGVDTTSAWIHEEITFDAAYAPERMKVHLYRPPAGEAPLRVVMYFPGSGVLRTTEPLENIDWMDDQYDFIVKSGRAVVFPVFKGTLDRSDGFRYRLQDDTRAYRDHVITWGKEVGRTLDYIETRPDLDSSTIAYYGFSWGGRMGGIMLALHSRLKSGVLHSGGLSPLPVQPEADPFNFLPRVTQPVLMLNSEWDGVYPVETSARPLFERLGTPSAEKELVVTHGGHFIPRTALMRETLRWLEAWPR